MGGNEMRNVVAENITARGHTFPNRSEEPQGGWRRCQSCVWGRGPVRTFGCIVKQSLLDPYRRSLLSPDLSNNQQAKRVRYKYMYKNEVKGRLNGVDNLSETKLHKRLKPLFGCAKHPQNVVYPPTKY